ncbi:MAG: hypothetical protein ACD_8C00124G0026 [uncultured bacterium]|nr:MAG: hypothetical protein ACD_8C00124G0026 [uncultured bacterium]
MAKLFFANTRNTDMRYLVSAEIPDNFFLIEKEGKKYIYLDQREIGAFLEHNKDDSIECFTLESVLNEVAVDADDATTMQKVGFEIIKRHDLLNESIEVPGVFPLSMADYLRKKGVLLNPMSLLLPERLKKNPHEVEIIQNAISGTKLAFEYIEKILREGVIRNEEIIYQERALTSEFLKKECEKIFLEQGLLDIEGMIISCGPQSAMPHHRGHGLIRPNQAIICDLFPWHRESGYFADMTRTYVKGVPSKKIAKMYMSVKKAQEMAIDSIKPGVKIADVHAKVQQIFLSDGFDVGEKGFTHGTGHGLGLDLHEEPYINKSGGEKVFEIGNVVTVEPGLYYSEFGGVRIEDVVCVIKNGCKNLTNYPKELIIVD